MNQVSNSRYHSEGDDNKPMNDQEFAEYYQEILKNIASQRGFANFAITQMTSIGASGGKWLDKVDPKNNKEPKEVSMKKEDVAKYDIGVESNADTSTKSSAEIMEECNRNSDMEDNIKLIDELPVEEKIAMMKRMFGKDLKQ